MKNTYKITVFNTLNGKYEKLAVSKEIYHAYMRTEWNIKDKDKSFFKHEIQFTALIGGEDGAFENFHELIDTTTNPDVIIAREDQLQTLYSALSKLTASEWKLIYALFFEGETEQAYAASVGVKQQTVHKKKKRILKKIKNHYLKAVKS